MSNSLNDFLEYQAQTSPHPMAVNISRAEGSYLFDSNGKAYLDFIAGVSACTLGHCHPKVVQTIQKQCETYMHVMVYGEFMTQPSLELCKTLAKQLPKPLQTTYLVNSGTEAIEGAIKLSKKATGRSEIIAARNAYHGSTQGSMSVMGREKQKENFRPLIPETSFIEFNNEEDFYKITEKTAAVLLETIQGSAGFIAPKEQYLKKIKHRCQQVGSLLILDEVQTGFGRTGKLFGFEHYGIIPDILVMGKGMASGMPIGAFTSSKELMSHLKENPKLGHITTFGGNPVIASAALTTLKILTETNLINTIKEKELFIRKHLKHSLIKSIKGKGLMLALEMKDREVANYVITNALNSGLVLFWLLFDNKSVRITPPLTISKKELMEGITIILSVLDTFVN